MGSSDSALSMPLQPHIQCLSALCCLCHASSRCSEQIAGLVGMTVVSLQHRNATVAKINKGRLSGADCSLGKLAQFCAMHDPLTMSEGFLVK